MHSKSLYDLLSVRLSILVSAGTCGLILVCTETLLYVSSPFKESKLRFSSLCRHMEESQTDLLLSPRLNLNMYQTMSPAPLVNIHCLVSKLE